MNNLQYLRTNYLRNIVILQRNQYVSRISSGWKLCGMCVFPSISSFVLKNSKPETIVAQGIQGFENVRFKNFQSEGKRTKRTFENCTKVLFVNIAEICVSRETQISAMLTNNTFVQFSNVRFVRFPSDWKFLKRTFSNP